MSGGVDSSVCAHLLKQQGHEVIGVRFALWVDPTAPAKAQILPSKCCTTESIIRANTVAKNLGFPLHVVDLSKEFKKRVVDAYLDAQRKGLTPNPCVVCNRIIKFSHLAKLAKKFGCDRVATGHYARTDIKCMPDGTERIRLLEATDKTKDQSYYLHGLTQTQLKLALFPLGTFTKKNVFTLARAFGVPLSEHYLQSQDLCFFPEKTPQAFLKRHLKEARTPGPIVNRSGTVLGSHEGLPLYTIGQRRGLRIGGQKIPLEVVRKEPRFNRLVLAPKGEEMALTLALTHMRFVSWKPEDGKKTPFACRTRSLSQKIKGTLMLTGTKGLFRFSKPQPLQTPGQSLVLYKGEEVIGGGIIR